VRQLSAALAQRHLLSGEQVPILGVGLRPLGRVMARILGRVVQETALLQGLLQQLRLRCKSRNLRFLLRDSRNGLRACERPREQYVVFAHESGHRRQNMKAHFHHLLAKPDVDLVMQSNASFNLQDLHIFLQDLQYLQDLQSNTKL